MPSFCLQGWSHWLSIPSKEVMESLSCTSASTSKTHEKTLPNNSGFKRNNGRGLPGAKGFTEVNLLAHNRAQRSSTLCWIPKNLPLGFSEKHRRYLTRRCCIFHVTTELSADCRLSVVSPSPSPKGLGVPSLIRLAFHELLGSLPCSLPCGPRSTSFLHRSGFILSIPYELPRS